MDYRDVALVNIDEFVRRRTRLLSQMQDNSVCLLKGNQEIIRNNDAHYPFRQSSDFYYLTGFNEPEASLLLMKVDGECTQVLFCLERDPKRELWDGALYGTQRAQQHLGFDAAYPVDMFDEIVVEAFTEISHVYLSFNDAETFSHVQVLAAHQKSASRKGATHPTSLLDVDHMVHQMRRIKSAVEIEIMQEAGRISALGHVAAMKAVRPGMMEYELEAEVHYHFMRHGARSVAYNSIVAGGANACVLHYIENDKVLHHGDLVLIDAGCEYKTYAGDITRTFPVSGVFSEAQKALYEVVLQAQLDAIAQIRVNGTLDDAHQASIKTITKGLVSLGLLAGDISTLIEEKKYLDFFMHGTSHWLGLDVHDVGRYKVKKSGCDDFIHDVLEEGMCLTVEPGIYVAPDNMNVDKKWRGIGIRIEDDIVVQKDGPLILTSQVPKTIAEIEALMQQ